MWLFILHAGFQHSNMHGSIQQSNIELYWRHNRVVVRMFVHTTFQSIIYMRIRDAIVTHTDIQLKVDKTGLPYAMLKIGQRHDSP
jgi:hypothetical protein